MHLNAVIIDDELFSVNAIEKILTEFCHDITIIGKTCSPFEGIKFINERKPDIVFLDIEMPGMNGFELLESITDRNFDIIFITAYDQYAIRAFKTNAIDYILKPLSIKEVVQAVNKVIKNRQFKHRDSRYLDLLDYLKQLNTKKVHIPTSDGVVCVNSDEIIRVEGDGRYSRIHLRGRSPVFLAKTLKELEDIIHGASFFRVHKSHIINMTYVKMYNLISTNQVEMADGAKIDVARRKKDDFIRLITSQ